MYNLIAAPQPRLTSWLAASACPIFILSSTCRASPSCPTAITSILLLFPSSKSKQMARPSVFPESPKNKRRNQSFQATREEPVCLSFSATTTRRHDRHHSRLARHRMSRAIRPHTIPPSSAPPPKKHNLQIYYISSDPQERLGTLHIPLDQALVLGHSGFLKRFFCLSTAFASLE